MHSSKQVSSLEGTSVASELTCLAVNSYKAPSWTRERCVRSWHAEMMHVIKAPPSLGNGGVSPDKIVECQAVPFAFGALFCLFYLMLCLHSAACLPWCVLLVDFDSMLPACMPYGP